MKFRRYFVVCLSLSLATPAFSNCPGPGCPALHGMIGGVMLGVTSPKSQSANTKQRKIQKKPARSQAEFERVRGIQEALNFLGFDAGTVDGRSGPATRAAIRRYQAARGFAETGNLSASEERALRVDFQNAQLGRGSVPSN